jgi:hypothetical protein
VAALLVSSCAGVTTSDYANSKPKLVLEEYFNGELQAWGMFLDRGGKVVRRFTVDIKGTWNDNKGELVENFVFDDGEKDQRIWNITRNPDGSYTGAANDVVGPAIGQSEGSAVNWQYTMSLPVDGSVYEVKLNDWMYLVNENVLMNRAVMSKFGFRVGEVVITFKRREQAS